MPQPYALQLSQRKVCGEQEHVHSTSLKHWLLRVCQVMGLTFSLCSLQSYCHLQHNQAIETAGQICLIHKPKQMQLT